MNPDRAAYIKKYLSDTKSVLNAGKSLRQLINSDVATLNYAIEGLENASEYQKSGGIGYQTFMFSELDALKEEDKEIRGNISEEVFVSVLIDMQKANLLIASGLSVGQPGAKMAQQNLDEALFRLGTTTETIERSLSEPVNEGMGSERLGFSEEAIVPEAAISNNLADAMKTFTGYSNETLETLVSDVEGVVTNATKAIMDLRPNTGQVLSAISRLGDSVQAISEDIGRLIQLGLKEMERAVNNLIRLLGNNELSQIKSKVENLLNDVTDGRSVAISLEFVFGTATTKDLIKNTLNQKGLEKDAIDRASNEMVKLRISFKDNMSMAKKMVSTLTFFGGLLSFAFTSIRLWILFAYIVIFAGVILIGMDYADSGMIQRIRGVRDITRVLLN